MTFRGYLLLFTSPVSSSRGFEWFGTLPALGWGRFCPVSDSAASSVLWQVGGVDGICSLVEVFQRLVMNIALILNHYDKYKYR